MNLGGGNDVIQKNPSSGPNNFQHQWDLTATMGLENDIVHLYEEGSDTVSGGPGTLDQVTYGFCFRCGGVTARLDGGTGDDALGTEVEVLVGSPQDDMLFGGSGNDRISGQAFGTDNNDTIEGGDGNDTIDGSGTLRGQGGQDSLGNVSSSGLTSSPVDRVLGGDGNDTLSSRASTNGGVLDGGAGNDGVYVERGFNGPVNVSLDDIANDGAAGEAMDVIGVESVSGSTLGPNRITGDDGPNSLFGGPHDDELTGRGGADVFFADDGNDTVNAADGVIDNVNCGAGTSDVAVADLNDNLAFFTPGTCETIRTSSAQITSGPSGAVNSSSAQFTFEHVSPNPPPGRFECAVDNDSFTSCASPRSVSGLSDGEHVFKVRYHPDGEEEGVPAERRWTVDATPPVVTFEAAPAGEDNPPDTTIAFRSSEPDGAVFRCAVDSGQFFDCSSPHSLTGLSPGEHSFSVQAFDRVGNQSATQTATWSVGTGAPVEQTATCDPGAAPDATLGGGTVRLVAREAAGCFVDEEVDGRPAKVARGDVTLNGIGLDPAPNTRIIVSEGIGDGTVRADGPLRVSFGGLFEDLDDLELTGLISAGNRVNKELSFAEGALLAAGMESAPGVAIELTGDNGGQAKVTMRLTLPKAAFKQTSSNDPTVEGVSVEFAPTVSNDRGVTFGGRIKLGQVFLFGKKIKDLDLAYDHGTGVFDGSFGIALAESRPGRADPTLSGRMSIAPTDSACFLRKLGIDGSNLQKHVGDGVFLQRLGGTFECATEAGQPAMKLTAAAGASLGPRIAIGSFETEAVSLDGTGTLTIPTVQGPIPRYSFELKGNGKIADIPVTEQRVKYTAPDSIEMSGSVDLTVGGVGARLALADSWINENGFNYEYAGQLNLFGAQASAEALISTFGFAACAGPSGARIGFGKLWTSSFETLGGTCDLTPFRDTGPVSGAQAGERSFTVAPRTRLKVVAVAGSGAPPKVALIAPDGARLETPAGLDPATANGSTLLQDEAGDRTFVVLRNPAAGSWKVAALGDTRIERLQIADGLPPVRIAARVSGRGARRTLNWRVRGLGSQSIQFVERSPGSAHVLGGTRKANGKLRFRPDPALGRRRTVDASVTKRGMPRLTRTVARFRVAPPPKPREVIRMKLRKGILTWRRQPGIRTYEVGITSPGTPTTLHTARTARLKLRSLPRSGRLRVQIVAVNAVGRVGPAAEFALRLRRSR
jgi:hypothetical protein